MKSKYRTSDIYIMRKGEQWMEPIQFYLPDLYNRLPINILLKEMMMHYPERFYDNIAIGAVYGSFPGAIWNGGRVSLGSCTKEQIEYVLNEFNSRGIPCRFTFTNPLLEEKHLYDTFCNLIMTLGDNGMNEVIVNSPLLEDYIREQYPKYKIISSTTKCLEGMLEVTEEAQKDYALVVLDNSFNNTEKLFSLMYKEKYELIPNSYCVGTCPKRREHYKEIGRAQLQFRASQFPICDSINRDFYDLMANRSFITQEALYGKYYEAGFRHFKLDGRGFNLYNLVESYMYYFVRPEARDAVRVALLKANERF